MNKLDPTWLAKYQFAQYCVSFLIADEEYYKRTFEPDCSQSMSSNS